MSAKHYRGEDRQRTAAKQEKRREKQRDRRTWQEKAAEREVKQADKGA